MFLVGFRALKKLSNNINRKRTKYFSIINPVSVFLSQGTLLYIFQKYWLKGKLRTYFTFKEHFIREKYTFINDFKVRQAICKIRISAHPLMIEIGYIFQKYWLLKDLHW
jgi:hypothetical protein